MNFVIIALGTSAAAQLGDATHIIDDKWLAGLAALVATFQLVSDFGVAAATHAYLQRRCYELLSELELVVVADEPKLAALRAKLTTLYGEEPPPMRALDAVAYNAACDSIGKGEERVEINWWQSLWRHVYPFNGNAIRAAEGSFSELAACRFLSKPFLHSAVPGSPRWQAALATAQLGLK